jgi:hypothetical protein
MNGFSRIGSSGNEIFPLFSLSDEIITGDGISGEDSIGLIVNGISSEFRDREFSGDGMTDISKDEILGMTGDQILSTVSSTTSGVSGDGISGFKGDGISGEEIFLRFVVGLNRNRTVRRSGKSRDFIISLNFGLSRDWINGIAIFGRAGYEIFGV